MARVTGAIAARIPVQEAYTARQKTRGDTPEGLLMPCRIVALTVAVLLTAAQGRSVEAAEPVPETYDHAAMAAMYTGESRELRQKAAEHELMLQRYERAASFPKGAPFPRTSLVQHCRKLIASYQEAASNAAALAKMEDELAGASQEPVRP